MKLNENCLLAMAVDPRFKGKFLSATEKELVIAKLTTLSNTLDKNRQQAKTTNTTAPAQATQPAAEPSLWDAFDAMSDEEDQQENQEDPTTTELQDFFKMQRIPRTNCPLEWWRENHVRYPNLQKVAQYYLGIPATQASSERLFSAAANIVTIRRANLLPEHVKQLYFLHGNFSAK